MTNKLRLGGVGLTYLFGMTILLGSVLSGLLSPDKVWLTWYFSKLGGGDTLSSAIFNTSLFLAGILIALLAYYVTGKVDDEKASKFFFGAFLIIATCFIGVSIFHYDDNRLVHDLFGYSMLIASVVLCLGSTRVMSISNQNYNRYVSLLAVSSVMFYFVYYIWHSLSLLLVELVIFMMVYIWLIMFVKLISELKDK